jgi:hypothetical protein
MKLKDCRFGRMVIDFDKRVGFVVGVAYNVPLSLTSNMTEEEKFKATVPIVEFPDGRQPINPVNIEPFE